MRIVSLAASTILCLLLHLFAFCQNKSTEFDRVVTFPSKFLQNLNSSANKYEQKLTDNTEKFLKRVQRQEARFKKELSRKDSLLVNAVFSNTDSIYNELVTRIQQRATPQIQKMITMLGFWIPYGHR